jgi:hypothetical protein
VEIELLVGERPLQRVKVVRGLAPLKPPGGRKHFRRENTLPWLAPLGGGGIELRRSMGCRSSR